MFKLRILASLLFVPVAVFAQTAEDYFHGGAQHYVHGRKEQAKVEITSGLSQYPEDPKLKAMVVLLQKEEEKKQPDRKDQKQDQQNQQQKDSQQDKQQQAQKNQPQKKEENQQSQAKNQKDQQKKEPAQAAQSQPSKDQQSKEGAEKDATPAYAGQMTPQQARQLLDAAKAQEAMLPLDVQKKPLDNTRRFKDW
jgi:outer membrane biosynthesis protein TonB